MCLMRRRGGGCEEIALFKNGSYELAMISVGASIVLISSLLDG